MDVTERSGDHGIVQKKCLFLCNFSNRLLRHIISESQRHVEIARDPKYILFVEPYLSTYNFDGPVGLDHVRWTPVIPQTEFHGKITRNPRIIS